MPTVLRSSTPTARKPHRCYTCNAPIAPGEKYHRAVYLGDDGLYEWVTCPPCHELVNVVWDWAGRPDEGVTDEEFTEWARESTDDPRAGAFLARVGAGSKAGRWIRGSWMQTFTGRQFYPLDPKVEEIDPDDIAHALSLICRYGGHVSRFYSVAEHCLLMSYAVPAEHALWALLHDATEAYVGDMVRPLKQHMPEYRAVEDALMAVIAERFGLRSPVMPAAVKEADNRILLDERATLLRTPPAAWAVEDLEPLGVDIVGYQPARIEQLYLNRLTALCLEERL